MSAHLNQAAIDRLLRGIGEQVRGIVNTTAAETTDGDLDDAVELLHRRLNAIDGIAIPREWCHEALETLRRGDDLTIQFG